MQKFTVYNSYHSFTYIKLYTQYIDACNYECVELLPNRVIEYYAAGTGIKRSLRSWRTWRYYILPKLQVSYMINPFIRWLLKWNG